MTYLRVLLIAPNIDGTDVGEGYAAFKWAEALSNRTQLTVLSFQRFGREPLEKQLPKAEVVTWPEPAWLNRFERINAMLKPAWPLFCRRVRKWIQNAHANGRQFDIAHQVKPGAARYAAPLLNTGIPYIIGPLAGNLPTPVSFRFETKSAPLFTRLRALDSIRFRYDPWLRASFIGAEAVLGVAPYVRELLADIPLKRFVPFVGLGIDALAPKVERSMEEGRLKLLHVGRGVRTKGLRDIIRALAQLSDMPNVTLTSAGHGEEIEICRREAERLNVADRVTFLGGTPRAEIEQLYAESDVFVFPSFREPAGQVLYEAMRWGLPVITVRCGGPDGIVDDSSAIRLNVTTPQTMARDLALAVRSLATNLPLRACLGVAARKHVAKEGMWLRKVEQMLKVYNEILTEREKVTAIQNDEFI